MKEYPNLYARVKNLSIVSRKLAEGVFAGNYRSVFKGPGLEFDEVREYTGGDDVRSIDWNVTSRMDSPYSKQFREEREINFFFIIDVSASVDIGLGKVPRREMLGLISSLLAYTAIYNNDRVGAIFYSNKIEKWIPPMKGQAQVIRIVNDMMNFKAEGKGSDLGLAVSTVNQSLKKRGICVILSDFKTDSGWRELTLLSKKHDVIAIKVTDPIDSEFPIGGLLHLEDPETGYSRFAMVKSRGFQRQYKDFWEHQHYYWLKECQRRKIRTLMISTEDDPVVKLMNYFRRRKG